jgi:hypothetical protein
MARAKPGIMHQKLKLSSIMYSTCHQLQNDVRFTGIGEKLMI